MTGSGPPSTGSTPRSIAPLMSLFEYHKAMLAFNTGLTTHHPYQSKPWTWLLI